MSGLRGREGEGPLRFRLVKPGRELAPLRGFLSAADPADYLLTDLAEWSRQGRLWVGEEHDEWVAFGRLHDLGGGEGWVSGVRVAPARRREGIGARLLDRMLSDARASGLTALRAVIEDANLASRRLFHRSGFRPILPLVLRRGLASPGSGLSLHRARPQERLDGPVGWIPALADRVDLLPGTEGGRYGTWRRSLILQWAHEGKLYVGPGLAAAVQLDWWSDPRTLWVNPLQGEPAALFPALGQLAFALKHQEWQAFLPSTEVLRRTYESLGTLTHPAWGDRVHLYERLDPTPVR